MPPRVPPAVVAAVASSVLLVAQGCSDEAQLLVVDLRTDFVPGVEFTRVRTEIVEIDGSTFERFVTASAQLDDDFVTGERIAELEGLRSGTVLLRVQLLEPDGTIVAERPVRVVFEGALAVTVLVTRDCRAVTCPGPTDPMSTTACVGGGCTDPACTEETPEACTVDECTTGADCPPGAPCTTSVCVTGVCLFAASPTACSVDEYCDPVGGCSPRSGDFAPSDTCEDAALVTGGRRVTGTTCDLTDQGGCGSGPEVFYRVPAPAGSRCTLEIPHEWTFRFGRSGMCSDPAMECASAGEGRPAMLDVVEAADVFLAIELSDGSCGPYDFRFMCE